MVESLAAKLGCRLSKIPQERKPVTDWAPVFEALSAARESLGFGAAHNTGSAAQLRYLAGHTPDEWAIAIASQRDNLRSQLARSRLTRDEASAYLSIQTISRNFDRCLQNAKPQAKLVRLADGRWVEESDAQRRILTEQEAQSRGLDVTSTD
jgi:hypothetical protein